MILSPFQSHRYSPPVSSPLRPSTPSTPLPVYNFQNDTPDTPGRQPSSYFFRTATAAIPINLRLKLKLVPGPRPHLPRRKLWSFLALFMLLVVSLFTLSRGLLPTYNYISRRPSSSPLKPKGPPAGHNTRLFMQRKQIELSPSEELAAVVQFLTSQTSNSLPLSVNPLEPIDPQLVCGFDTRSQRAVEEVRWMKDDVWTQHPVLLFIESHSTVSRYLASIINDYNLSPPPPIFAIDERSDAAVLLPLLQRLTSSPSFPLLLVGGELVSPSIEDIKAKHEDGTLKNLITDAGGVVGGGKKKKSRR